MSEQAEELYVAFWNGEYLRADIVWVEVGNCHPEQWCAPLTGTVRKAVKFSRPDGKAIELAEYGDGTFWEQISESRRVNFTGWRRLTATQIWDKEPAAVGAVEIARSKVDRAEGFKKRAEEGRVFVPPSMLTFPGNLQLPPDDQPEAI